MSNDTKAELASELVDYVWYKLLKNTEHHTKTNNGSDFYIKEADDIWCKIYDIVDEVVSEQE